ncbi:MAG: hypothetical protein HY795_07395 [Desulfovibrio sp.]|nr:hypothetical protein [Desulfovibrio sp.]MBI4960819.1 hypothetical protein [Desulfovibrio sp.]
MNELASVLAELEAPAPARSQLITLQPARAKAFVRLAIEVVKLHCPRPIYVQNSRLSQPIGHHGFLVDIDLGKILSPVGGEKGPSVSETGQGQGVSFAFQAIEEDLRRLLAVAGGAQVSIFDQGDELVFANAHTQARLLKAVPPSPPFTLAVPADEHRIGEEVKLQGQAKGGVRSADLADLKAYIGKSRYVTLLCCAGQLEQVQVQGKSPFTLHEASTPALEDKKPDLACVSQHFLALAGQLDLRMSLFRNEHGLWLKTSSRASLIDHLTTYECLYEGSIR